MCAVLSSETKLSSAADGEAEPEGLLPEARHRIIVLC